MYTFPLFNVASSDNNLTGVATMELTGPNSEVFPAPLTFWYANAVMRVRN